MKRHEYEPSKLSEIWIIFDRFDQMYISKEGKQKLSVIYFNFNVNLKCTVDNLLILKAINLDGYLGVWLI